MSLPDLAESDIESISSTSTRSEQVPTAQTEGERVGNVPTAAHEGPKHARFFFDGNLITFLVEGTLYRVHEYLFTTNSTFWADKLREREDKTAVIELEDVVSRDMDALLSILYDASFHQYDLKTSEAWESVLRLATRWKFDNIRSLAILKLDPLAPPIQQLVMARAFDVPKWLQPSLVALCMRSSPLTVSECKQLSPEDIVSIMSTREAVRQKTQSTPNEQDVSSYVARHVLHTEPIDPPSKAATSTLKTTAHAATLTPKASISSATRPLSSLSLPPIKPVATVRPVAAPLLKVLDTPAFLAIPSAQNIQHLLAAVNKSDFDSLLSMATEDGTKAFIDALSDFTAIKQDFTLCEKLVIAILRRSSKYSTFVPVGARLLSSMSAVGQLYCGPSGIHLKTFLTNRATLSEKTDEAMSQIRSRFGDFTLAVQHVTRTRTPGSPHAFFDILSAGGISRLDAALYDERYANLKGLFSRLRAEHVL
ncbi:unnamed protein product [Peniophora sp. CBMAI 1063]|nr:unnamed protein product [Peniophora sp. CBMAI 1063]